jgi:hypothetical protein
MSVGLVETFGSAGGLLPVANSLHAIEGGACSRFPQRMGQAEDADGCGSCRDWIRRYSSCDGLSKRLNGQGGVSMCSMWGLWILC